VSNDSRTLSEAASKELLRRHGVPFAEERVVDSVDAAVAAAREVGMPAVVKLNGDRIAHKTERGLVRLGLATEDAVAVAATELLAAATPEDGEVSLLVAPMLRGARELIAGLLTDPQFGRVVMLGIGGIFAEALGDVAFRLVPFDLDEARSLLDDLRMQTILGPFRGEPAIDRDAVAAVLVALAEVAVSEPSVASVDLNPLIIVDGRPIAVDALVETRTEVSA
jgi:acetyl-CoA synthetase (ADP-forming)